MKRSLFATAVVLTLAGLTQSAHAFVLATGDPILGGSWSQPWIWTNDGHSAMDRLDMSVIAPSQAFGPPGMSAFNLGGWNVGPFNSQHVSATGPAFGVGQAMTFTSHHATVDTDPANYLFTSYSGGVWNEGFLITRDANYGGPLTSIGGGWYGRSVVPEPATLTVLGLALAGSGLLRRRRRVA